VSDGIIFVTDDAGKWGTGKGAPLIAAEADGNFWELLSRVDTLETGSLQPVSIDHITGDNGAITIFLTDGSQQGPFPMPVPPLIFRGEWQNSTSYAAFNMVRVTGRGVYLVLQSHTTPAPPAPFDPAASGPDGPLYMFMVPSPTYDVAVFVPGPPGFGLAAGDPMFAHAAARPFTLPANLSESHGFLSIAPAADLSVDLAHNGTVVGGIAFPAGVQDASFFLDTDTKFKAGDLLTIAPPPALDSAARNLALTLAGRPE
jgi:hypothetical protein